MPAWRNSTGHPLSSPDWLDIHHSAKLPERTRFAKGVAAFEPQKLVDLGCATGLWLDLLDQFLPSECEFIGIDNDPEALDYARRRARQWSRPSAFIQSDIASEPQSIPCDADVLLAFNILSYLPDTPALLKHLAQRSATYRLIVRQYDGGTIRIGPLSADDRFAIDSSLRASLEASSEFSYYGMDDIHRVLLASALAVETLEFELTQRHTPFPPEFRDYFASTIGWMMSHLSDNGRDRLSQALGRSLYFAELDLVAVMLGGS